jgi:hypothetical protein
MRIRTAAAGSAVFLVIAPGTVAGLAPWWLTGWQAGTPYPLALRASPKTGPSPSPGTARSRPFRGPGHLLLATPALADAWRRGTIRVWCWSVPGSRPRPETTGSSRRPSPQASRSPGGARPVPGLASRPPARVARSRPRADDTARRPTGCRCRPSRRCGAARSRSSWLSTVLTDTDTAGTTASACEFTRSVTCSRSLRRNGRTSIDDIADILGARP